MKNTYIIIIVLILVLGGVWMFAGKDKSGETPTTTTPSTSTDTSQDTDTVNNQTPTETTPTPTISTPAVKEFTISAKNFSFTPSAISVNKGDKVKITFENTAGFHDFVIDEYGVAAKQAQAPATEVLEFTADKVGSFEYYCSVGSHRSMGMKGTLTVTP